MREFPQQYHGCSSRQDPCIRTSLSKSTGNGEVVVEGLLGRMIFLERRVSSLKFEDEDAPDVPEDDISLSSTDNSVDSSEDGIIYGSWNHTAGYMSQPIKKEEPSTLEISEPYLCDGTGRVATVLTSILAVVIALI